MLNWNHTDLQTDIYTDKRLENFILEVFKGVGGVGGLTSQNIRIKWFWIGGKGRYNII